MTTPFNELSSEEKDLIVNQLFKTVLPFTRYVLHKCLSESNPSIFNAGMRDARMYMNPLHCNEFFNKLVLYSDQVL